VGLTYEKPGIQIEARLLFLGDIVTSAFIANQSILLLIRRVTYVV